MSGPVNVLTTSTGKLRPVCEFCGRIGRAVEPDHRGRIGLFSLARGWSEVPYPADFRHDDGSTGSLFACPACDARLRAGEGLTPCRTRGGARRTGGGEMP